MGGLDPPIQSLQHEIMMIRAAIESDVLELAQLIARSVHALNAVDDSQADLELDHVILTHALRESAIAFD